MAVESGTIMLSAGNCVSITKVRVVVIRIERWVWQGRDIETEKKMVRPKGVELVHIGVDNCKGAIIDNGLNFFK